MKEPTDTTLLTTTASQSYAFSSKSGKDIIISADLSYTEWGFFFRLRCGEYTSPWSNNYLSPVILVVGHRTFALCTGYWDGTFPVERPFEIVNNGVKII
jgi:hypothetical protein